MRAYYGSRFSKNMTATPEGFLICHNVPISRTGWYEYLGKEIGLDDKPNDIVKVYRSPEEVFSDAAIASFEGKPLTDEHPPTALTPDNATIYGKGVVQNVRQGSGAESDLLIADLVVYDKTLIGEIQDGKREVSSGYDLVYVDRGNDTYQQEQIVGNHVAVVKSGRAGDRVAIKDSKENLLPKGETRMKTKYELPKKKKSLMTDFLVAVGLKQLAMDAEPEKIAEAVDAIVEERGAADDGEQVPQSQQQNSSPTPAADDTQDPAVAALGAKVDKLTELVTQLISSEKKEASPEDALDAMISQLEGQSTDDDEEESHTIPAESMDDEGPVSDPEDRPQRTIAGDNAYKIAALKAMKPILAAIADPVQRKQATDAAIASIQGKPSKNTYAAINKAQKKVATDKQTAADKKQVDHSQLGMEIAKKWNPHYKNKA